MMVVLLYTGTGLYRGYDPVLRRLILAEPGHPVVVSAEKAKRLLHDFPQYWRLEAQGHNRGRAAGRRKVRRARRHK